MRSWEGWLRSSPLLFEISRFDDWGSEQFMNGPSDGTVRAHSGDIDPNDCALVHGNPARFDAMKAEYDPAKGWTFPPVLVAEEGGGRHVILDGHHRIGVAKGLGIGSIPALIVAAAEYRRLLNSRFEGMTPNDLRKLYPYIAVDDEGTPYSP